MDIARKGLEKAVREDAALKLGINTYQGSLVHSQVAAAHDIPVTEPSF